MTRASLVFLTALLLVQLAIRAHNITALPVFTDEEKHIDRAAKLHNLEEHPAKDGRGKFLFYFLPGIFDLDHDDTALHLARSSVALASLLTTALLFLICRHFFDERSGLIAAAFYALAPYAFFFERMALADAFAGLVATTMVWFALRFAQRPHLATALGVGVLMAFTPAAKLTMSFVAVMPAVTILLLGQYKGWPELWERWGRWSLLALGVTLLLWLTVLIPAYISTLNGEDYILFEQHLVGVTAESTTFMGKLGEWWEKMARLLSVPLSLLWLGVSVAALRFYPQRAAVLWAWLGLAWFPTFFIVADGSFQSRYLMAGMPAVAALFGVGLSAGLAFVLQKLGQEGAQQRRLATALAALLLAAWTVLFALPFALRAATDPARLTLPPQDQKDYLSGWFNGYGLVQALDYLGEQGQPDADGEVYTLLHARFCMPDYYDFAAVEQYTCFGNLHRQRPGTRVWQRYISAPLEQEGLLYVVTDNYNTLPAFPGIEATLLYTYEKPYSQQPVEVWRWEAAAE